MTLMRSCPTALKMVLQRTLPLARRHGTQAERQARYIHVISLRLCACVCVCVCVHAYVYVCACVCLGCRK